MCLLVSGIRMLARQHTLCWASFALDRLPIRQLEHTSGASPTLTVQYDPIQLPRPSLHASLIALTSLGCPLQHGCWDFWLEAHRRTWRVLRRVSPASQRRFLSTVVPSQMTTGSYLVRLQQAEVNSHCDTMRSSDVLPKCVAGRRTTGVLRPDDPHYRVTKEMGVQSPVEGT